MSNYHRPQKFDRLGYYDALHTAIGGHKDQEIGYGLLLRVKQKLSAEITEKDITNARLYVNHCKNPNRDETFKHAELLVIQNFTGNHSVLDFDCQSLGRAQPRLIDPHELHRLLTDRQMRMEKEIRDLQIERMGLQDIIEGTSPSATLVEFPGSFSAS